jgi:hypothetical protein
MVVGAGTVMGPNVFLELGCRVRGDPPNQARVAVGMSAVVTRSVERGMQ